MERNYVQGGKVIIYQIEKICNIFCCSQKRYPDMTSVHKYWERLDGVSVTISSCTQASSLQVSEEALHHSTEDEESSQAMEPYLVRRLSSRNIQLPPLAFRQLEQADWDKKNDTETIPRPTTLPLRIPPLIAITSAESSSRQLSTTQPLAHSPSVGWGRESEERNMDFIHSHRCFEVYLLQHGLHPQPQMLRGVPAAAWTSSTATDASRRTLSSVDLSLDHNPFRAIPAVAQT
ncbi:hypothetical protein QYF61_011060 [Mycteria americana]|uniref:Uncharacterized protein n=1 Tax=Mycteria americana TaxID=33587 RepID=A0AAN7NHI2_MYCAM|nr:hypothetical protein QYF61_011060 [Mycteria americana]